jgi:hypothetical protein
MRPIHFRSATALALILPVLMVSALATSAVGADRRGGGGGGGGGGGAPHFSAPAAHFSAPVQHFSAPAQHFSAPVHIEAQHFAPQHFESRHVETHNVTPHVVQHETNRTFAHQNIQHPNTVTSTDHHEQIDTHGKNNVTGAHELARHEPTNNPSTNQLNGKNANQLDEKGNQGHNGQNQQAFAQERSRIYANHDTKPVLHNQAFADARNTRDPAMRAFARNTFEGRFDRDHDRDHRRGFFRGIVIGWGGPVFWPYAYPDFVDYVFWPYGDDTFWPYAYDDVYDGIFGAYAPDATAYGYAPVGGSAGRAVPRGLSTGVAATGTAQVCSGQASGLTDFPIQRIADQVNPTDAQRSLLNNLRDATLKAVDLLKSNCPVDVPSTPTGRLGAMRQRIDTMLQAVQMVRPPLEAFYQSLSDEQKERFIALEGTGSTKTSDRTQQLNLAQSCGGQAKQIANLPTKQIEQLLHPNSDQEAALGDLNAANGQAADLLSKDCAPSDQPLTPTGRVAAMEQRLRSMEKAIDTVQPALAKFYNSLSDEQKARFDRLGPRQG